MNLDNQPSNLIRALLHYNACVLLSFITAQAAFSFAIPFYSSVESSPWLLWTLGGAAVVFHISGVLNYYLALQHLNSVNTRKVLAYILLPLGSMFLIIELSQKITVILEAMDISLPRNTGQGSRHVRLRKIISSADIGAIREQLKARGQ